MPLHASKVILLWQSLKWLGAVFLLKKSLRTRIRWFRGVRKQKLITSRAIQELACSLVPLFPRVRFINRLFTIWTPRSSIWTPGKPKAWRSFCLPVGLKTSLTFECWRIEYTCLGIDFVWCPEQTKKTSPGVGLSYSNFAISAENYMHFKVSCCFSVEHRLFPVS